LLSGFGGKIVSDGSPEAHCSAIMNLQHPERILLEESFLSRAWRLLIQDQSLDQANSCRINTPQINGERHVIRATSRVPCVLHSLSNQHSGRVQVWGPEQPLRTMPVESASREPSRVPAERGNRAVVFKNEVGLISKRML